MDLIFGGAYQGKLEYAKRRFHLTDADVYLCGQGSEQPAEQLREFLDSGCSIFYGLERFTLACVRCGAEAAALLQEHARLLRGKILIAEDISCGVVPTDREQRAWREMNGRAMVYLGQEAETVARVFCGLELRLK